MVDSYTVVLSTGTQVVSADEAMRILHAVDQKQPYIEIQTFLFEGATQLRTMIVVIGHVVALFPNKNEREITLPAENVRFLAVRRPG